MTITLLRLPQLLAKRGKSRSSHYTDVKQRLFTKGVLIGKRAVAWPLHETEALIRAQIAGVTDDEMRALVCSLEAARKGGEM